MNLLKTSFYTSIGTAVTFVCGFIVAKVVAVKIGPAGIAMVGQFQNTTAILTMLGSGAINMGVVKYLSQNNGDTKEQQSILSNSFSVIMFCSLTVSGFTMVACRWLSLLAFHTTDYWIVYFLFGLCLTVITLNAFSTSVFNGLQEIRKLTISNVFLSVVGVLFTVLFAYLLEVKGVLLAANATALVVLGLNLFLFRKTALKFPQVLFKSWNKPIIKKLLVFSLMSFVSSLISPLAQLAIRNKIILDFSITEAGYWQGVTKISDYYLSFITTVLGVYFLPKLSEIQHQGELKREIWRGYQVTIPVVAVMAFLIWIFRCSIILILFSKEFLPMNSLFTFQLVGDVIKIASWLLAFLMVAKAMARTFIITEIVFTVLYVLLSFGFINKFGIVGATYAFALNYSLYFIYMIFIFRKFLKTNHADG